MPHLPSRICGVAAALVALGTGCTNPESGGEHLREQRQALTLSVPRRIKALEYSAFRDNDTLHEGNCGSGPVDAEVTGDPNGGDCNVGWTRPGEWLDYSVQVATAGKYNLTARVASALSGKTFRLSVDGRDLGSFTAPSAGWQAFADRGIQDVSLSAGTHTLRVSFETGDMNLNYLDVAPGRVTLPARIEAEDYQRAFDTTPNVNSLGACDRGDGVDKGESGDNAGGGCNVGWIEAGEWLEYDVNVAQAGSFDILARVASASSGKTLRVQLDGSDIGTLSAPNAGWAAFRDRTLFRISLAAGPHTLRVTFPAGEVNFNYLNVTTSAAVALVPSRVKALGFSAFYDSDALHEGNCGSGPVDAEITSDANGGGCAVSRTRPGEWLDYSLQVPIAGKYHLAARVASALPGKTFRLLLDAQPVGSAMSAPSAGWQAFSDRVVKDVQLGAGAHILRVAFDTGDVNLHSVDIAPGTVDLPARIEAESYARAFETTPEANSGAACDRADGVDKAPTGDVAGGGCSIGWTAAGEWLEYDVNVGQAAAYDFTVRVGSGVTGRTVSVSVDGNGIGTLAVPNLGWATFQDRTLTDVNVAAGPHVIRVSFPQGDANFNFLSVTRTAGCATDADCSDANSCNGVERCDNAGQCVAGQPPILDDGNACTVDTCSPATGPVHAHAADGAACDDGNACTRSDSCQAGACQGGNAVVCTPGDSCHQVGSCDVVTGVCSNPVAPAGSGCSDGNACNGVEVCDGQGSCAPGQAPVVDDGNPCTEDSCDPSVGVRHLERASGTSCSNGDACDGLEACDGAGSCRAGQPPLVDDGNPCTSDSCTAAGGVVHAPLPAGAACSDDNTCNGAETCDGAGACRAGLAPVVDDGNPCTIDSCDANRGVEHVPANAGLACDDASVCNGRETCDGQGQCRAGEQPTVDDDNPCTVDTCDAVAGVSHAPGPAGSSCSNDDACDGSESCDGGGNCVASAGPQLDDGNPCTVDSCDPTLGVQHAPAAIGTACTVGACTTGGSCNAAGVCAGAFPRDLDDHNPCTLDSCDEQGGVKHTPVAAGTSCSDQNACNGAETCSAEGTCVAGAPPVLDDQNPCTTDSCSADAGVSHIPVPSGAACDDDTFCNGRETCDGTGACIAGAPPVVDDGNECTADECNPALGVSHVAWPVGFPCADDDACNGEESCNGGGQCVSGAPPDVDDGNPCTADSCSSDLGAVHVPVAAGTECGAATACNAASTCNANGECVAGQATSVDDGNPCTSDSCSPSTGIVHAPRPSGTTCSNGDACDGGEACDIQGQCAAGTPLAIDDGNPCTADSCDPATGVQHAPVATGTSCSDGNSCNGAEVCSVSGVCESGTALVLDDGNPCTIDSCDTVAGVTHTPKAVGTSCSDGNPCNGVELCSAEASCVAGATPQISDDNPCTDDSCDPVRGVIHEPRPAGSSCADADACNGLETCSATGACQSAAAPVLDDGNPCTADSCSAGTIVHTPIADGTACSDGNACNGVEACVAGACQAGAAPSVDDGNACTIDACNPSTGVVSHTPLSAGTSCDNASVCDGRETCNAQGVCQGGTPPAVDDANPCTQDSCHPTSGVSHTALPALTACDDQTLCNGRETCSAQAECLAGTPPALDDGNPCTSDGCDPNLGVAHTLVAAGTSCSDGNACNGQEQCSAAGLCVTASAPVLDDGNPCTIDSCNSGTGNVQHLPVLAGTSCPDQNVCNGAETCNAAGVCVGGAPATVDDGNPCTADSCDALNGVRHLPIDTPECVGRAGWTELFASQPSPRDGAAGAFIGTGELLLFGGNNAGAVLGDAWLWSPVTRAWRKVASGPSARAGASLAYDAERSRAVLFGGVDGALSTAAYLNDVWEYDASTDAWTQRPATGGAPAARALAAFAFDSVRGRAVLFGGVSSTAHSDTWEWNAAQGSWTQLSASGPEARYGAAFAFDAASGAYALFGGSPGNASGVLDDTWTLSADTGTWQRKSAAVAPPGRAGAVMAFDTQASRFVLAGGTGASKLNHDDTWELDAQNGTWQPVAVSGPTFGTGSVLGFDAQALRITLATGLDYSSSGKFTPQSSAVWQLDRQAARWTDRSSRFAPTELRLGAAFDSSTQAIVALGPLPPPERPLMWSFDPRTSEWSAKDISIVDQPFSDGEFDGTSGGTNGLIYSSSLQRLIAVRQDRLLHWDGQAWSKRCDLPTIGSNPLKIDAASFAFDATTQRLYVAGGRLYSLFGQPPNNDVYRIDVATCSGEVLTTSQPASPKSRDNAVAVWDATRGRLIQFGGVEFVSGNPTYPSETWELDPSVPSWTQIPGAAPPGRTEATAVYDSARRRVVVHGGRNAAGLLFDTWELDPETRVWTELQTTGPAPGEQAALTFDETRQAPALVSTRGAVWHLSNGVWVANLNPVAPSARSGMSGGWSPVTGLGLFFGGTSGDGQRDFLGDLWLWRDGWRGVYPGADGNSLIASGQGTSALVAAPAARTGHVFATGFVQSGSTPTHTALLFGGEGASDQFFGLYGDTWTFDEGSMEWRAQAITLNTPRGRTGHAMTVVPTRGYLMFGGLGRDKVQISGGVYEQRNTLYAETWLWRQSGGWLQLSNSNAPSARYGHALVTDETTNEVLLFGGRTAEGVSGETWALSLNGLGSTAAWRKLAPSSAPLPRFGHSMAYDPVRRKVVLSGGEGASPNQTFGDTWEWDSATQRWSLRNIQPLEGRAAHVSFFDRTRGQLIAFGGFAHRENGQFALTYGDTLTLVRAGETDPSTGLPNGARCTSPSECGSANCVDGFCCNSTCTGQCGACDVSGFEGTCTAVGGVPHGGRTSCGSDSSTCASQCDGIDMSACHTPGGSTSCGGALGCGANDTFVASAGACDGAGSCVQSVTSCLPYNCCPNCSPAGCRTDCQSGSNNACGTGHKCNRAGGFPFGVCYKPTQITSFTANPVQPVVGAPVTLSATATEPDTEFRYAWRIGNTLNTALTCTGSTCTWTPTADQAGQTVIWTLTADAAPATRRLDDDSRTLTLTVGQP